MEYTGLNATNILLPDTKDLSKWACIACDQFTSEIEYWNKLKDYVGESLSTLNLILPEIYLEDNADLRIETINRNIKNYIENGVFYELDKGFVLTVRKTKFVERRIGLVGALDLECYEYAKKSDALIRSTEGTIEERIPPRLKIRKDADIEFPHIMVLFDDEKKEILEELYKNRSKYKKLYDFELNMEGGRLEGYFIDDYEMVLEKFSRLLDKQRLIDKYGKYDKFAFAVGDGNHSLATAKTHWNNLKKDLSPEDRETHPARFALAEFVNIYDEGIYFEPIYRFVKGVDRESFINKLNEKIGGTFYVFDGKELKKTCGDNPLPKVISSVDEFIKEFIKDGGNVDYVHGEENIKKLVKENEDSVGILFDKLNKKDLFYYVSNNGAFPRKTFSMGEGIEKRYYMEGKKITK